jgi:hypothetical protein
MRVQSTANPGRLFFLPSRAFTLNEPERILAPVFQYPDGETVSLLAGAERFLADSERKKSQSLNDGNLIG